MNEKLGERANVGTTVERWILHPNDPKHRCAWPTAALARRLSEEARRSTDCPRPALVLALAQLADFYSHLLTRPIGTRAMVKRLRDLRRLERGVPT